MTVLAPAEKSSAVTVAGALLGAAVVASIGNALVAAVAHAAGASSDFRPLEVATFVPLTVIGTLLGALGWSLVGRRRRGASTLRWLVPVVLAVSFVPDLLLGISQGQPHTTWTGVVGLMAMHLVVAGVVVPVLARVLPVRDSEA